MSDIKGVKKVNERILKNGRTLILTEEDVSKYNWDEIPNGTLHINEITGLMSVKIEGETTWLPAGIRNDGTICIAKDSRIGIETFKIKTVDNNDGTFTVINEDGEQRHFPLTEEGYHVFELEDGSYIKRRNHLDVFVDETLLRNSLVGGLIEMTERRFALNEELKTDMTITAKYIKVFNIGHPYPRIFVDEEEPEDAEYGDFWLDTNAVLDEEDIEQITEMLKQVQWNEIINRPTTLAGYGILDKVALDGHVHKTSDITNFPTSMRANGGNADTVGGFYPGNGANRILKTNDQGKIEVANLPKHPHTVSDISDFPTSLPANGGNADYASNAGKIGGKTIDELVPSGSVESTQIASGYTTSGSYNGWYYSGGYRRYAPPTSIYPAPYNANSQPPRTGFWGGYLTTIGYTITHKIIPGIDAGTYTLPQLLTLLAQNCHYHNQTYSEAFCYCDCDCYCDSGDGSDGGGG